MRARRRLDPAAVVATAAEIADAEGIQAATVTRVAAVLGIRAPSLYNHVAGGDGLRRGIALLALRELADELRDAAVGRGGRSAAVAVARAYRRYALAHPGRYAAIQPAPAPGDAETVAAADAIVSLVGRLVAAPGADAAEVVHAVRAWRSAMHGFVDLELEGGFGLDVDLDESYERLIALLAVGIPPA